MMIAESACRVAIVISLLGAAPASGAAQGVIKGGIGGGVKGVPTRPAPGIDPADARLLIPTEFKQLDTNMRLRVMQAWANGAPESAGPRILPLVETGLLDRDPRVREQALLVLYRIESVASANRFQKIPVVTDAAASPSLLQTLIELTHDANSVFRARVIRGIQMLGDPPPRNVLGPLLDALPGEPEVHVRAAIIRALGPFRKAGEQTAQTAIFNALASTEPLEIVNAAIAALGAPVLPEALPHIMALLSAVNPEMRLRAANYLGLYRPPPRQYRADIEKRLEAESDPKVQEALRQVLEQIARQP